MAASEGHRNRFPLAFTPFCVPFRAAAAGESALRGALGAAPPVDAPDGFVAACRRAAQPKAHESKIPPIGVRRAPSRWRSYPFTRKTFPVLGGRVEPSNEEWDGIDPDTGEAADWLKVDDFTTPSRSGQRRCDDDPGANPGRVYGRGKRARSPYLALEGPSSKTLALTWTDADATVKSESSGGSPMELEAPASRGGGESHRTLHRDLKMLMDALRQIPTPRRAALAIEGMLSKPEVQYALEKFGTGSELGLTRKELAAIAVLQDAVSYQGQ